MTASRYLETGAGLEAGDVGIDSAAGQHEERVGSAAAPLLPLEKLHLADVRDEVRRPDPVSKIDVKEGHVHFEIADP